MAADKTDRWQLTKAQRELVNNCFEEYQYETAIATLDQLCDSEFSPWPWVYSMSNHLITLNPYRPHIRQLIYISLHPTEDSSAQDEADSSAQISPSKIIRQQQSQLSMNFIPMKAVLDAQRVLVKYLHTNQPDVLSRALPRRRSLHDPAADYNEAESTVARQASYIMQYQDCWELLCKDLRQNALSLTLKAKPRAKRQSERLKLNPGPETGLPVAVQENAWPLLDWLVSLFEYDEQTSTMAGENHTPGLIAPISLALKFRTRLCSLIS